MRTSAKRADTHHSRCHAHPSWRSACSERRFSEEWYIPLSKPLSLVFVGFGGQARSGEGWVYPSHPIWPCSGGVCRLRLTVGTGDHRSRIGTTSSDFPLPIRVCLTRLRDTHSTLTDWRFQPIWAYGCLSSALSRQEWPPGSRRSQYPARELPIGVHPRRQPTLPRAPAALT
jgi:hypothetical protein